MNLIRLWVGKIAKRVPADAKRVRASAWAKAQRALLTGDALGGNCPQPEKWGTDYQFVPRIDGIPTGVSANVQLYRVSFAFGEVLPLYPAT